MMKWQEVDDIIYLSELQSHSVETIKTVLEHVLYIKKILSSFLKLQFTFCSLNFLL